jgi:hypothetical protein
MTNNNDIFDVLSNDSNKSNNNKSIVLNNLNTDSSSESQNEIQVKNAKPKKRERKSCVKLSSTKKSIFKKKDENEFCDDDLLKIDETNEMQKINAKEKTTETKNENKQEETAEESSTETKEEINGKIEEDANTIISSNEEVYMNICKILYEKIIKNNANTKNIDNILNLDDIIKIQNNELNGKMKEKSNVSIMYNPSQKFESEEEIPEYIKSHSQFQKYISEQHNNSIMMNEPQMYTRNEPQFYMRNEPQMYMKNEPQNSNNEIHRNCENVTNSFLPHNADQFNKYYKEYHQLNKTNVNASTNAIFQQQYTNSQNMGNGYDHQYGRDKFPFMNYVRTNDRIGYDIRGKKDSETENVYNQKLSNDGRPQIVLPYIENEKEIKSNNEKEVLEEEIPKFSGQNKNINRNKNVNINRNNDINFDQESISDTVSSVNDIIDNDKECNKIHVRNALKHLGGLITSLSHLVN